jgi:hypothetical protein
MHIYIILPTACLYKSYMYFKYTYIYIGNNVPVHLIPYTYFRTYLSDIDLMHYSLHAYIQTRYIYICMYIYRIYIYTHIHNIYNYVYTHIHIYIYTYYTADVQLPILYVYLVPVAPTVSNRFPLDLQKKEVIAGKHFLLEKWRVGWFGHDHAWPLPTVSNRFSLSTIDSIKPTTFKTVLCEPSARR